MYTICGDYNRTVIVCWTSLKEQKLHSIAFPDKIITLHIVSCLIVKPDGRRYCIATHRTARISGKKLHVHRILLKATLTRGAFKQTSQEAVTTVAETVVLLLAATGECVLSATSSHSYSSVELLSRSFFPLPYLRFPPLQIFTCVFRTCVFHPCISVLAFSILAFSTPL